MISEKQRRCLQSVKGPVFPIPTPFTRDEAVDWDALRTYVDWLVRQGARTIMVTVGTSRFSLLDHDEMRMVNETVIAAVDKRAYTIVTGPPFGSLSTAVHFARHAAAAGADAMLAVYPERYYGEQAVFDFFREVSEAVDIGVMIHLAPMLPGPAGLGDRVNYSPGLVERIARLPGMVGMKEESNNMHLCYAYNRLLHERFCIIGGAGCMRAFLAASVWRQPAYLVGVGNFAPKVELDFFSALTQGNMDEARRIIDNYETPFFDQAVRLGWHLALKEALAAHSLMPAWERRPLRRLDEADREVIRKLAGA